MNQAERRSNARPQCGGEAVNRTEVMKTLPCGGFLRLRKIGRTFRLTALMRGLRKESDLSAQEVVEAMSHIVSVFARAGVPGGKSLSEDSMGFMQDACNVFPELAERYRFMAGGDRPLGGVN